MRVLVVSGSNTTTASCLVGVAVLAVVVPKRATLAALSPVLIARLPAVSVVLNATCPL